MLISMIEILSKLQINTIKSTKSKWIYQLIFIVFGYDLRSQLYSLSQMDSFQQVWSNLSRVEIWGPSPLRKSSAFFILYPRCSDSNPSNTCNKCHMTRDDPKSLLLGKEANTYYLRWWPRCFYTLESLLSRPPRSTTIQVSQRQSSEKSPSLRSSTYGEIRQ